MTTTATPPAPWVTVAPWAISRTGRIYRRGSVTVADHSTAGLTTDQRRDFADAVWALESAYPINRPTVHVSVEPADFPDFDVDDNPTGNPDAFVAGSTTTDTRYVVVNERNWTQDTSPEDFTMPVARVTVPWLYVLVHEWSHASDPDMSGIMEQAVWLAARRDLSPYGRTIPEEGYAEARAEWILTHGQTNDRAARLYARAYNWSATVTPTLPTQDH